MRNLILFAIAVLIGLGLFIDNSFLPRHLRNIASDESINTDSTSESNDLSQSSETVFKKAFKYKLILPAKLTTKEDQVGIRFGNFYLKNAANEKAFVCSVYNKVRLIFEADGIAVSGNIPQMIVSGPCLVDENVDNIQALMLPLKQLSQSMPTNHQEVTLPIPESQEKITLQMNDIVDQWPNDWNLVLLQLYSDESQQTLELNGYEIISILGKPLSINIH